MPHGKIKRKLTAEHSALSKKKKTSEKSDPKNGVTTKENKSEEDEISIQIKQERMNALQILDSMLQGKSTENWAEEGLPPLKSNISGKKSRSSKDEEICSEPASNQNVRQKISDQMEENRNNLLEENKESSMDTSLKQLFGSSGSGNEEFKFLPESEDIITNTEIEQSKEQSEQLHPPQIESSRSSPKKEPPTSKSKLFFFHSTSKTLRNRLEENTFYRTKSLEELEQAWPDRRTSMWQSFKRRKRDALRLGRKKKQQRYNREKD